MTGDSRRSERIRPGERVDGRPAPAPGPSGPRRDGLSSPENRGRGVQTVYSGYSTKQAVVDLLTAYRLPISISCMAVSVTLVGLWWTGNLPTITVPPIVWSTLFWMVPTVVVGTPTAYLLLLRFREVEGKEVMDCDPIGGAHRHLRVGDALWENVIVKSPWGSILGTADLSDCSINDLKGYEMMDFRIVDSTPICVVGWPGEASVTQFRNFRYSFEYHRKQVARRAEKYSLLRANVGEIANEAAEEMMARNMVMAEQSGIPGGAEIGNVVDGVMSDHGLDDPAGIDWDDGVDPSDELGDDRDHRDLRRGERADRGDPAANGHSSGHAEKVERVDGVAPTDGGDP